MYKLLVKYNIYIYIINYIHYIGIPRYCNIHNYNIFIGKIADLTSTIKLFRYLKNNPLAKLKSFFLCTIYLLISISY